MGAADPGPDAESVRLAALVALDPGDDPRLRELLSRARLDLDRAVRRWEGSDGTVSAHKVTLALDAATLARVHNDPFLRDGAERAVARAMARWPRDVVDDVAFAWNGVVAWREDPYRGAIAEPGGLAAALRAWMLAEGDEVVVDVVSERGDAVTLRGDGDPLRRRRVELALKALRGPATALRWAR